LKKEDFIFELPLFTSIRVAIWHSKKAKISRIGPFLKPFARIKMIWSFGRPLLAFFNVEENSTF